MFAMIVWSACTALTPMAAGLGSVPIISIRILLGAGEGKNGKTSVKILSDFCGMKCSVFLYFQ